MGVNVFLEGGASIGPDHCLSPPSADLIVFILFLWQAIVFYIYLTVF